MRNERKESRELISFHIYGSRYIRRSSGCWRLVMNNTMVYAILLRTRRNFFPSLRTIPD